MFWIQRRLFHCGVLSLRNVIEYVKFDVIDPLEFVP